MIYLYKTDFKLSAPIKEEDFESAFNYLVEDEMANYVDDEVRTSLVSMRYVLTQLDRGTVFIVAKRELTEKELAILKQEIEGQNSDGLGEGFCSQDFAEHETDNGEYESIYIETEVATPALAAAQYEKENTTCFNYALRCCVDCRISIARSIFKYDVDNLERLSEEVNYVLPTQGVPEVAIAIMRSRELITVSCLALLFIVVILALFVILKK